DTEAVKHEAQTETQHPVFAPLGDQWEAWTMRLKYQRARQAVVAGHDGRTAQIWTMPVPPYTVLDREVECFRQASVQHYGIPHRQAEEALAAQPSRMSGAEEAANIPAYEIP